jgi:hypothetical protein
MAQEPQEEVGTLTESCTTAIDLHPYVTGVRRSRMPEMLCDVATAPLLGVVESPLHSAPSAAVPVQTVPVLEPGPVPALLHCGATLV